MSRALPLIVLPLFRNAFHDQQQVKVKCRGAVVEWLPDGDNWGSRGEGAVRVPDVKRDTDSHQRYSPCLRDDE